MAVPAIQTPRTSPRLVWERIIPLTFPIVLVITILLLFGVLPGDGTNKHKSSAPDPLSEENLGRREAIKAVFDFAWEGYYTTAFPHDELKPVTNSPGYSRNDWGASAVDALTTAILMEKSDVVKIVLAHVKSINFNETDSTISVFESTIRYMGGLISAYELLTGPFVSLDPDPQSIDVLLDQAQNLGEVLSAAFVDENALPSGALEPHTLKGNGKNSLAGAGTLVRTIRCIDIERN
jgi:mannosyl-oligosaccharide alpha-1,2-mannosidase